MALLPPATRVGVATSLRWRVLFCSPNRVAMPLIKLSGLPPTKKRGGARFPACFQFLFAKPR